MDSVCLASTKWHIVDGLEDGEVKHGQTSFCEKKIQLHIKKESVRENTDFPVQVEGLLAWKKM